jgi:hypothetical protein
MAHHARWTLLAAASAARRRVSAARCARCLAAARAGGRAARHWRAAPPVAWLHIAALRTSANTGPRTSRHAGLPQLPPLLGRRRVLTKS